MSRTEEVISVFVASPCDVMDERDRLEDVIREINRTWAASMGVRLDLVRWETHVVPAIGLDPQAIINDQVDDDYDIFIGIMWARFGSPTPRAGSGTEEEFLRAKTRYDANPGNVKMMLYFKQQPIPPTIDLTQLGKVQQFKATLGSMGVLYFDFADGNEFESLLRMHLSRTLQRREWKGTPRPVASAELSADSDSDEPGLLDLIERAESQFLQISDVVQHMGETMSTYTAENERITGRLEAMAANGSQDRAAARRLLGEAATNMTMLSDQLTIDLSKYRDSFASSIESVVAAQTLSAELQTDEQSKSEREQLSDLLKTLQSSVEQARSGTQGLYDATKSLPRLTTELNAARRKLVSALDLLLAEFSQSVSLLSQSIDALGL